MVVLLNLLQQLKAHKIRFHNVAQIDEHLDFLGIYGLHILEVKSVKFDLENHFLSVVS